MLAVTYIDYPMANHGIGFDELRARLRERRLLGFGFGGAVMIALAVPVLNFLVVPCAVAGRHRDVGWSSSKGDTSAAPAAAAGGGRQARLTNCARRRFFGYTPAPGLNPLDGIRSSEPQACRRPKPVRVRDRQERKRWPPI